MHSHLFMWLMKAWNCVFVLKVCSSIEPITCVQFNHISSLYLVTEDDYYVEERSTKRHRRSNSIRSRSRSVDRDESSHGGRSNSSTDHSTSRHRRGYSRERSASTHEDSDHRRHLRKNKEITLPIRPQIPKRAEVHTCFSSKCRKRSTFKTQRVHHGPPQNHQNEENQANFWY